MQSTTMTPFNTSTGTTAASLQFANSPSRRKTDSPIASTPTMAVTPDRFAKNPTTLSPYRNPQLLAPLPVGFGAAPVQLSNAPVSHIKNTEVPKRPKKPKRPLTAYHIYFQIEREFIIQTMAGEDADKSIHDGKTLFYDVPDRYKNTMLSPDWYLGPGKRAKRKHRKQHGKIGFLELSRVISTRWSKLEETDPDIKLFVSKLAKQEDDEYKRELKEYREKLTKMIIPAIVSSSSSSSNNNNVKKQAAPQVQQQCTVMPQHQMMAYQQAPPPPFYHYYHAHPHYDGRYFMTHGQGNAVEYSYQQQRSFAWGKPHPRDDFDHCVSYIDNNRRVPPKQQPCHREGLTDSPTFLDAFTLFDEKSDEACADDGPAPAKGHVEICDDDIFNMWSTTDCQ